MTRIFAGMLIAALMAATSSIQAEDVKEVVLMGDLNPVEQGWKKTGKLDSKPGKIGEKTVIILDDQSTTDAVSYRIKIPKAMAIASQKGFEMTVTMMIAQKKQSKQSNGIEIRVAGQRVVFNLHNDGKNQSVRFWDPKLKKHIIGKIEGKDTLNSWKITYQPETGLELSVNGKKVAVPFSTLKGEGNYIAIGGISGLAKERIGTVSIENLTFKTL